MVQIVITDRDGQVRSLDVSEGLTLMEVIRDNGFDELLALCGGCCSCATCHVFIEGPGVEAVSPMSDDEDDLLDSSAHRGSRSRLSCQIQVTTALNELFVVIAPEE